VTILGTAPWTGGQLDMDTDTFTVGDMSLAAYGYLAGYPMLAIEKAVDGYTRFVFRTEDARAMQAAYRDPRTVVPLQGYLAALKYLQTLRSETQPGTTQALLS
jgi:hypothetical protein